MRRVRLWPLPVLLLGSPSGTTAAPFAYITNSSSGTVSVIDTATDTIAATVPVGNPASPYGVAVNRAGTRVYVTDLPFGRLDVIDTLSNSVTDVVPVGRTPYGVAVNPAGTRAYVANGGNDTTLSVVDTASNAVIATVQLGPAPYGVAVSPPGTSVYVTSGNTTSGVGTVWVIDAANNTVTTTVRVGAGAGGVAANRAGTRVYVATSCFTSPCSDPNSGSGVSVIDTGSNVVTATIPTALAPRGVAVNPAGTRVYVTESQMVEVIDTVSNSVVASVPVGHAAGSQALGVAVHPTGTKIYVASNPGCADVIDASTNTVVKTVVVGSNPIAFGDFIGGICDTMADCNDGDACTADACDPATGCSHTPIACDDDNPCTSESCDPSRGCLHAPISGCVPVFRDSARVCEAALASRGRAFASTVHRLLSACLDRLLRDVADGKGTGSAAETCGKMLDLAANPQTLYARARATAATQIAKKCAAVTPADLHRPCDAAATTITQMAECILDQHVAKASQIIAAEFRDGCSMLAAVGLDMAFPAVCSGP